MNASPSTTATTVTGMLVQLLAQAKGWLIPRVEADCARHDLAKLRIFVRNMERARDLARLQEEGLADGALSLSATMAGLADTFASFPDGATLDLATIQRFVAVFNEAEATAWALEMRAHLMSGRAGEA